MTEKELCRKAMDMLQRSYIPYSHFAVGAALECTDGTVFTGCNIENATYTPTVCAERVAFFKAVSEGRRDFKRIAIAGRKDYCVPCGVCRQVMREFCDDDFEVICLNGEGDAKHFRLKDLLPFSFSAADLT